MFARIVGKERRKGSAAARNRTRVFIMQWA